MPRRGDRDCDGDLMSDEMSRPLTIDEARIFALQRVATSLTSRAGDLRHLGYESEAGELRLFAQRLRNEARRLRRRSA